MDYDEILEDEHKEIINYCEELFQKDLTGHYNVEMLDCSTKPTS
jgi:hypothetical protein